MARYLPTARAGTRRGVPAGLAATLLVVVLTIFGWAPRADAAVTFRSTSSVQNGAGSTTLTIPVPAGTVAGDVMVLQVDAHGPQVVTPPSGWTVLYSGSFNSSYAAAYWRVASSEPASYVWNLGASTRAATGQATSYSGVDNSSPIDGTAAPAKANSGTAWTASSYTTGAPNSMVVVLTAGDAASAFTLTQPGGATLRNTVYTSGAGTVVGALTADFLQAVAGPTGAQTTTSSLTGSWDAALVGLRAQTAGNVSFGTAPQTPALQAVTLNGAAQTANATMNNVSVSDTTGSSLGWNVTVAGDASGANSAVFKRYCPLAGGCGTDPLGYVAGGAVLPAGSLQLNTTGASWSGGTGGTPTFACAAGCSLDGATATKIATAAANGGLATWTSTGLSSNSLALSIPTTVRALPASEVYRVSLVWTLSQGP
jgi:hypothetical protein